MAIYGSISQDGYVVVESVDIETLQKEVAFVLNDPPYGYSLEPTGGPGFREVKAGLSNQPRLTFWQALRRKER